MREVIKVLEWDSAFFGRRIARLYDRDLLLGSAETFHRWVDDNNVDCVYFLCDAEDITSIKLATKQSFAFVDLRVKLTLDQSSFALHPSTQERIRVVEKGDIDEIKKIAMVSHRMTRFYRDGNFSTSCCDNLYGTWIEKSCEGQANVVYVIDCNNKASGYVTCHLQDCSSGSIGLLGVAESLRGKGAGRSLVTTAIDWLRHQGTKTISVVTQGHNLSAMRLYQRCGFMSKSTEIWFHYWPKNKL